MGSGLEAPGYFRCVPSSSRVTLAASAERVTATTVVAAGRPAAATGWDKHASWLGCRGTAAASATCASLVAATREGAAAFADGTPFYNNAPLEVNLSRNKNCVSRDTRLLI